MNYSNIGGIENVKKCNDSVVQYLKKIFEYGRLMEQVDELKKEYYKKNK